MRTANWSVACLLAGVAVTAACGDSNSSLNPTAPSAVIADGASAAVSDGVGEYGTTARPANPGGNGNGNGNGSDNRNGNGNGNDNRNDNGSRPPTNSSPGANTPVPPGRAKVEIEGLLTAVGGDSVTVRGQVVTVTDQTVIRHGNTRYDVSALNVGDRVHVRANRVAPTATGVAAVWTLEAAEIRLQNPGEEDGEDEEPTPLVSVAAADADAFEAGLNTGTFRLTRAATTGQLMLPLTVSFTLTGAAQNGVDYVNVPLTVTFPAGAATVDVVITPVADGLTEPVESVVFTLTAVPLPYELGSPLFATVNLADAPVEQ